MDEKITVNLSPGDIRTLIAALEVSPDTTDLKYRLTNNLFYAERRMEHQKKLDKGLAV